MPQTKIIESALRWAAAELRSAGMAQSARESEDILGHCLSCDRTALLAHGRRLITVNQFRLFRRLILKRRSGWPLAYLVGHQPFYSLDFMIDQVVLIPRPETEGLVDLALKLIRKNQYQNIADVGTGSGCIAVTIVKYRPSSKVYAVDRSRRALHIAQLNARRHQVSRRIEFRRGNLLAPLKQQPLDLIIANLPYLTPAEIDSEPSIRHEPRLALNAGADGLEPFRVLFNQLKQRLDRPRVLLEVDPRRIRPIERLIKNLLPERRIKWQVDMLGRMRYGLIDQRLKTARASRF